MTKKIYMDHAATTQTSGAVAEAMIPFLKEAYGNPSSAHSFSRGTKKAIDEARITIAQKLNCERKEVFFTSGGTEANNWAIKGTALANQQKGKHLITTSIEHKSVLESFKYLSSIGFEVTYLDVDHEGKINLTELKQALRKDTTLVSIMTANNEIGTIQPIKEIGEILSKRNILFHTDAVQGFCKLEIDVQMMNIDLLTLSAHKIYGPKGIGATYVRSAAAIENLIHGGNQERARRSGTENLLGIVGLGAAVRCYPDDQAKIIHLRDLLIEELLSLPHSELNGPKNDKRISNNVNISFDGVDNETLLLLLDMDGIYASGGSACTSGAMEASHVVLALGKSDAIANSCLRLSIGSSTTEDEIRYVVERIAHHVNQLR